MEAAFYISAFLIVLYGITIFSFARGWGKLKKFKLKISLDQPNVTIVVACRNEENEISGLLDSLARQSYPKEKTEIIIVNDHSTDNTENSIRYYSDESIQLLNLPGNITGKKKALQYGISLAKSEIIITTDADCIMNENWIVSMVNYYLKHKPKLLVGPVILHPQDNPFQKLQSLEFLSLIGSGAGAIGIGKPIMCNGANLLFEKSVYENAVHNNKYASGDDIFLLLSAKKKHRKEIHFIKSTDAIVYTKPTQTVHDFFKQRIRWTSKSKGYRDFDVIFTAIIVAISNLVLASYLMLSVFMKVFFLYFLFAFIIKSIVDLILLVQVSRFFKQQNLMWWFLPLQIIYPFYIIFTTIAGLFGSFEWKDRSYR